MKKYIYEIYDLLGEDCKKIYFFILLFVGVSMLDIVGLGLISPYISLIMDPSAVSSGIIGDIVNTFEFQSDQKKLLTIFGIVLVVVFLVKTVAIILINFSIIRFGNYQQIRIRASLMKTYQQLSYVDFLSRNSAEYLYNINQLVQQYTGSILTPLLRILSEGIVVIAILILLFWVNPMALVVLVSLLSSVVFGYDKIFKNKISSYGKLRNHSTVSMIKNIREGIEGLKEIRILGNEEYFHNAVVHDAENIANFSTKSQYLSIVPRYILELALVLFIVVVIVITIHSGGNLKDLAPTLAVFGAAAMRLLPSASMLSGSLNQLRHGRDAVSRLHRDFIKDIVPLPLLGNKGGSFKEFHLNNVSFNYPNAPKSVINNISFGFSSGEAIGIIGESGSGKSTLMDMILGLIKPEDGEIFYNSIGLNKSLKRWRSQVAYLPQTVFIIDDTLRSNIALGVNREEISDSKVYIALERARLSGLIKDLPKGIDTILGERGVNISGGQRQRIALARAFYHDRNVLVMDESTSALDYKTEQEVMNEIRIIKGSNKTLIIIAHRISTLKHCDAIYKLKNGKIVDSGSYEYINSIE
jgi:ATP-binding cassette, subfamily B, bacterial PglK